MPNFTPFPSFVTQTMTGSLSPGGEPGNLVNSCSAKPAPTPHGPKCGLEYLEVKAVAEKGAKTITAMIPKSSHGIPRHETIYVNCGMKPLAGSMTPGGHQHKDAMHEVSAGVDIEVTAKYWATCGKQDHPVIHVTPSSHTVCKGAAIHGSKTSFKAFRSGNKLENSRLWVGNGPVVDVLRFLWSFIEDPENGAVKIKASSCGFWPAGPSIAELATTVELVSEELLEFTLKIPPLLGLSGSRSRQSRSSAGEKQVNSKGEKEEDVSETVDKREERGQALLHYHATSNSEKVSSSSNKTVQSDTTIDAGMRDSNVESWGHSDGGAYGSKHEDEHSGAFNYLEQRGFKFSVKHNGYELELAGVKGFIERVEKLYAMYRHFRKIWEAGPGVEAVVGWSASWKLEFLVMDVSAKWGVEPSESGSTLRRYRGITAQVTPVSGSATASFGVLVRVERLRTTWMEVDLNVSITLSGQIHTPYRFEEERKDEGEWKSSSRSKEISGEIGLQLKAVCKVVLIGRHVGSELAIESGLTAKGEFGSHSPLSLEQLSVKCKPIVLKIQVWVGSTGEADMTYEQEVRDESSMYSYTAAA